MRSSKYSLELFARHYGSNYKAIYNRCLIQGDKIDSKCNRHEGGKSCISILGLPQRPTAALFHTALTFKRDWIQQ